MLVIIGPDGAVNWFKGGTEDSNLPCSLHPAITDGKIGGNCKPRIAPSKQIKEVVMWLLSLDVAQQVALGVPNGRGLGIIWSQR